MSVEIIKPGTRLNFIGNRYYAFAFSAALILLCLGAVLIRGGLNLGIDFSGGVTMQVRFKETTNAEQIRAALTDGGAPKASIQSFGPAEDNEFLLNLEGAQDEEDGGDDNRSSQVTQALEKGFGAGGFEVRRVEMVGPKVGKDLRQNSLYALYYSILMILIYISGRFEKKWGTSAAFVAALLAVVYGASLLGVGVSYLIVLAILVTMGLCYYFKFEYALGAILALAHDVIVTVGVFALLNKEITLSFVAAILTIVGYSLNDSIIIYDRVREHVRKNRKGDYADTVNTSINETLSRTVLTSGSTLMVLAALYLLGGPLNQDFALALFIGIATGTYSSIFISAPALLFWSKNTGSGFGEKDLSGPQAA